MGLSRKSYPFCLNVVFLQGVFINPAFIEPFGLTLIEVPLTLLMKLPLVLFKA